MWEIFVNSTCINRTQKLVPRGFGLDRLHRIALKSSKYCRNKHEGTKFYCTALKSSKYICDCRKKHKDKGTKFYI
jgi:hypothetical protein